MRAKVFLLSAILAAGTLASVQARADDDVDVDLDEGAPPVNVADAPPAAPAVDVEPPPAQGGDVSDVGAFNAPLGQYGEWIDVPGVGHVWRPFPGAAGPDFRPYQTAGHWVYADVGWTWVSDYPWGWATFHYGRWWFQPGYGWVWLPGVQWAPAWVDWRYGGDYVGWVPMAPAGFAWGVTFGWGSPWCFVGTRYLVSPGWRSYAVPLARVNVAYGATVAVPVRPLGEGRYGYSVGPPRVHVEAAIGHPLRPEPIVHVAHAMPPATFHAARPVAVGPRPAAMVSRPNPIGQRASEPARTFNEPARTNSFARPNNEYRASAAPRPSYSRPEPSYSRPNYAHPSYSRPSAPPARRYNAPSPAPTFRRGGGRRR